MKAVCPQTIRLSSSQLFSQSEAARLSGEQELPPLFMRLHQYDHGCVSLAAVTDTVE